MTDAARGEAIEAVRRFIVIGNIAEINRPAKITRHEKIERDKNRTCLFKRKIRRDRFEYHSCSRTSITEGRKNALC